MTQAPIAYIVYNRPSHTRKTFAAIRVQRPSQLFIIADGPRVEHLGEINNCREVREIVETIDWPCRVYRNYSETNLGCKRRISTGLGWVFSKVDRAIILEDDCLASPDFFRFCNVLLDFYKDNKTVWVVNGNSYQPQYQRGDGSYYFSRRPDCWGWATWRRAWQYYTDDMSFLDEWFKSNEWAKCFRNNNSRGYHKRIFRLTRAGTLDSWAHCWNATVMYHGGLSATPNANLVQNIGFDLQATNTKIPSHGHGYKLTQLDSLRHPSKIEVITKADEYLDCLFAFDRSRIQRAVLRGKRFILKIISRLRSH